MKIMDKVHIKKENKVGEISRTASNRERLKCNLLSKFYDLNILLNIQSSDCLNLIFDVCCTCSSERSRM